MKILAAHVENHEDWALAEILVQQDQGGPKALIRMEHEWEDRSGDTVILWSEKGFDAGPDTAGSVYEAEGYTELVDSKFRAAG